MEQDGSFEANGTEGAYHRINRETDDVYSTDYGWGLYKDSDGKKSTTRAYSRTYDWNERNQLVGSADANYTTTYVYGQDGQRSNKYTKNSETLYFNKMWTHRTDSGLKVYGGQTAKNIYLGETRIVTKLNAGSNPTVQEESDKQYFYHSDHLGSASLISDCEGNEYQRIEYTPYGEIWVEKTENNGLAYLPYKFTGKEMDEETGLYYYGARYLDPKYSRWISTDPALGEYIPAAGKANAKDMANLPGMGGIFNHTNAGLFHYAGNNPVRYIDPDGRNIIQLLDPNGARIGPVAFGHSAALVGNDKDGWLYYSNDGKKSIDLQWFATKEEFFTEYSATRGAPFNYFENIKVETNSDQDKAMQDKAFELAGIDSEKGFAAKETGERMIISDDRPSVYDKFDNNCSGHVGIIAEAGGLFSTSEVIPKLQWIGKYEDYVNTYGSPYTSF